MNTLIQDLRYGFRMLVKNPGFTAVAVVTLVLGIGANAAIFSVVNAVLLRPLPFRDPGRLVLVVERSNFPIISTSYQNYVDWRDQSRRLLDMEATRGTAMTLTGSGEPERIAARMATAGLFPLLGVKAALGRTFLSEEDKAGGTPVALISYGLWQRRFGGTTAVLGSTINLDAKPYSVVGVLPPGFRILQPADVYIPFEPWAKTLPDDRNWHPGINPVARLKPGVTMEQARNEMQTIASRLEKQYPEFNAGTGADVSGLQDQIVANTRPGLILLMGAVGLVLLIACANVANLLLARGASRRKEMAIRNALGASQARVLQERLVESALIGFAGGALGLLVARWTLSPLLKLAAGNVPGGSTVDLDSWVLAFTAGISILTSILFGVVPAWQATKFDVRDALSEASRGSSWGPGHQRLRAALVVTEIALAMLLTVGAGLLVRSFGRMLEVEPGFRYDHLLLADLPLSPTNYAKPEQRFQFFDRMVERAGALPGVRSAGAASFLPMSGNGSILHFNIYGRSPKTPHDFIATGYRTVTPRFFETLGIPLLKGRLFTNADTEKAPAVVILNAAMAQTFFPGEDPLGKHLQIGALPDKQVPWLEVVGVVGDVRPGLGVEPQTEMYLPYRQADTVLPVFQLSLALRTTLEPMREAATLRGVLKELDPNQPLVNVRTMEDNMAGTVARPRFHTWLLGIFAALAVLLAAVGVYGVVSYSVSQRTNEIGIRLALGAQRGDVVRQVVGEGFLLLSAGILIGIAGALALTRFLASLLYGVKPTDPGTFIAVSLLLTGVALVASYIPARRATKVDPMVALRYE